LNLAGHGLSLLSGKDWPKISREALLLATRIIHNYRNQTITPPCRNSKDAGMSRRDGLVSNLDRTGP